MDAVGEMLGGPLGGPPTGGGCRCPAQVGRGFRRRPGSGAVAQARARPLVVVGSVGSLRRRHVSVGGLLHVFGAGVVPALALMMRARMEPVGVGGETEAEGQGRQRGQPSAPATGRAAPPAREGREGSACGLAKASHGLRPVSRKRFLGTFHGSPGGDRRRAHQTSNGRATPGLRLSAGTGRAP